MRAEKIKIAAKSKPLAQNRLSLYVLIKKDMEPMYLRDTVLGTTYIVRSASQNYPILLLKRQNLNVLELVVFKNSILPSINP